MHLLIAAAAFVAIYLLHVPFPLIVLAAAIVGLLGSRLWPRVFDPKAKGKESGEQRRETASDEARVETGDEATGEAGGETGGEAVDEKHRTVIDDHAPPPAHTIPSRGRVLKVVAVALALWAPPLVALVAWRGSESVHAQEYLFFTKAALVTFGGAYAVLAYVTQVTTHAPFNWLTQAQAVDGLALAETTPGPLIMVLQFVGFMAAWNNAPPDMSRAASAVTGALVTTYATFLPSFVFIFLGAPYIERIRGNKNLTGALAGVTASVVGVIMNLALVFGAAVVFPRGLSGGPDLFAVVLGAAAFLLLYRFKADVLFVVLGGGLVGLARGFLLN